MKEKLFGYICFYNGKRIEVQASSLMEAKQKALLHFKPAKSKAHMISIVLAELPDGSVVEHTFS